MLGDDDSWPLQPFKLPIVLVSSDHPPISQRRIRPKHIRVAVLILLSAGARQYCIDQTGVSPVVPFSSVRKSSGITLTFGISAFFFYKPLLPPKTYSQVNELDQTLLLGNIYNRQWTHRS